MFFRFYLEIKLTLKQICSEMSVDGVFFIYYKQLYLEIKFKKMFFNKMYLKFGRDAFKIYI